MRTALLALTEELKRLKAAGVKTVPVDDASLRALHAVVNAQKEAAAQLPAPAAVQPESAPAHVEPTPAPSPVPAPRPPAAAPEPESNLPSAPIFTLPEGDKAVRWAALREHVLGDTVCQGRVRRGKQVVFGVGSLDASLMFIGEAPGAEEEVQGEPFVGPAGQLLTKMIAGMGLKREDVYIANIMNWRPDLPTPAGGEQYGNRPPTPAEMAYCLPYLQAQIEVVKPSLLIALGKTAAEGLLGPGAFRTLGEIRGKWREFRGTPLMVTYHPSYILRNATNRSKRMIWEDLLKVMERVGLPISDKQRGYFLS